MFNSKDIKRRRQKVLTLPQTDEMWEGTIRRSPSWVFPRRKQPYRPFLILVASKTGKILGTNSQEARPTDDEILGEILLRMLRPAIGAGKARRPKVLWLDNPDHVALLETPLAELEIRCEFRPSLKVLDDFLHMMERQMTQRKPSPGLLKISSVTVPLVSQLYKLADSFYRSKPWYWLNDNHPIEIRVLPEKKPRYAVVMGSGGEVFGLSVYDSLDDLKMMYQLDTLSHEQVARRGSWLVLYFDEATSMRFDDLDAIEDHEWPISDEKAYPFFGRTTRTLDLDSPSRSDLMWMEGALAGIMAYLEKHKHKQSPFVLDQPSDDLLSVQGVGRQLKVDLRFPDVDSIRGPYLWDF
jgi:hypothetical protein